MEQEELMSRVILAVRNYSQNKEGQAGFPHMRKGDFAIFVQLLVGKKTSADQYTTCLTVTDDLMEKWDVSFEELVEAAYANSREFFPGEICHLESFTDGSKENTIRPDGDVAPEVFVLTNDSHFNGAAVLFYQSELLDDLSEQHGEIALMPTGTNEIYCIAAESGHIHEYQQLFDEVVEAMGNEEVLSKEVLLYNRNSRELERPNGESFDPKPCHPADEQNFRGARRGR